LINANEDQQAYTLLWQELVGNNATQFFLFIVFVAIECSNCANLTSASRMVYAFARDDAIPFSSFLYKMDPELGCPLRAIWFCTVVSFILALPSLVNNSVLSALFSLTVLGCVLIFAWTYWLISARHWFKGAINILDNSQENEV
jgi:amino acid transporter